MLIYSSRLKAAILTVMFGILPGTSGNAQTKQVFHEDFSSRGALSTAWRVAFWVNGHPFGCTFSDQEVVKRKGVLSIGFSGDAGKCGEVQTKQYWQYGTYVIDMKPANVRGTVSSFFLYDGVSRTDSHHEIDIEFIGGTTLLHTNFWVAGQQHPMDIDLAKFGLDPYKTSRRYSFAWTPESVTWYAADDTGKWIMLRRATVVISTPMKLMMNAWYGDNMDSAIHFPGYYDGQRGAAHYRSVTIHQ